MVEGFGAWVTGLGDHGEGHRLAEERFPVEMLLAVDLGVVVFGSEVYVKIFVDAEAGAGVVVVDTVAGEEMFEVARLWVFAFVAAEGDEDEPAIGFEDAAELGEGAGDVEPVKGAAGGDHRDRRVGEAGGFGGAVADFEAGRGVEELLAGEAHFLVGFDGDDGVAVGEEDFGEHAGAGADVCDEPVGLQAAPGSQQIEDCVGWITQAVTIVGCGAAGEAFGVLHGNDHRQNAGVERLVDLSAWLRWNRRALVRVRMTGGSSFLYW